MNEVFNGLLIASLAGSVVILLIMMVRLLGRRLSSRLLRVIWAVAALRLLMPFTITSSVNVLPDSQNIKEILTEKKIQTGTEETSETAYQQELAEQEKRTELTRTSGEKLQTVVIPAAGKAKTSDTVLKTSIVRKPVSLKNMLPYLWLSGTVLMLLYLALSMLKTRKKQRTAFHDKDNVYWLESAESAYVFGLVRPVIVLPYNCREEDLPYVLQHEQMHIRMHDQIWKFLAFLALSVHWFNPLCWAGYVLFSRDLEYVCDERITKDLGKEETAAYTQALLNLSTDRSVLFSKALSFNAMNVKGRIRRVLSRKRASVWISAVISMAVLAVSACSLFRQKQLSAITYNPGTDWQYFQQVEGKSDGAAPLVQESEKGCYFYHDNFVYFYDNEADKIMPLCSKNNCLHDKETDAAKKRECNAYLDRVVQNDITLMLYQDDLYACYMWNGEKTDMALPYALMKIRTDGSSKDEVTFLDNIVYPLIHRGYLYYYKAQMGTPAERPDGTMQQIGAFRFCRMSIEGHLKEEVIYDPGDKAGGISRIEAYGNNVYAHLFMTNSSSFEELAFVYDINTGELRQTEPTGQFTVYKGEFYALPYEQPAKAVTDPDCIWHTDDQLQKKEAAIEDTVHGVSLGSDGRYFYVNNCFVSLFDPEVEKRCRVYDEDFNLVDEFTLPDTGSLYLFPPVGGDKYQYEAFEDPATGEWGLYVWDKSSIGTLHGNAYKQKKVVGGTDPSKIHESEESTTPSSSDQDQSGSDSVSGEIEYSEVTDTYLCEESEWTEDETDNPEYVPESAFGFDKDGEKQYYLGYWMDMQNDSITATAKCTQPGWEVITEVTGYYFKDSHVYERKVTASGTYTDTVTEITVVLQLPPDADSFIGGTVSYRTVLMAEDPDHPPIMESVAETAVGKISRK